MRPARRPRFQGRPPLPKFGRRGPAHWRYYAAGIGEPQRASDRGPHRPLGPCWPQWPCLCRFRRRGCLGGPCPGPRPPPDERLSRDNPPREPLVPRRSPPRRVPLRPGDGAPPPSGGTPHGPNPPRFPCLVPLFIHRKSPRRPCPAKMSSPAQGVRPSLPLGPGSGHHPYPFAPFHAPGRSLGLASRLEKVF
ncbi:MAG: hypothetical protein BWY88_01266 [Synergistetes bacterium ADurb.Bin520]|nr:MAG: hypothetical protein BWY88_01266 [Synergistetes bacterium ADurb.Bin520]